MIANIILFAYILAWIIGVMFAFIAGTESEYNLSGEEKALISMVVLFSILIPLVPFIGWRWALTDK